MKHWMSVLAAVCVALLAGGCSTMGALQSRGETVQKMTWKSTEEAMDNYRLVTPGTTTLDELVRVRGFDPERVSMALRVESPSEIRGMIMGVNPNVRYEDLTKDERACLDAKEHAQVLRFPIKVTQDRSEGNIFLDKFKFKKQRRETGSVVNALFCYNAETKIVLYKTVSYGPVDNMRTDVDPIPDIFFFLLFRGL